MHTANSEQDGASIGANLRLRQEVYRWFPAPFAVYNASDEAA
jgi:hypothetical protein